MTPRVKAFWDHLDRRRERGLQVPGDFESVFEAAADAGIVLDAADLWDIASRLGKVCPELTPPSITSFIRRVVGDRPGARVLDPWAGAGSVLAEFSRGKESQTLVGWYPNERMLRVAARLAPGAELRVGDFTETVDDPGAFDVVVSALPFGMPRRSFEVNDVPIRGDPWDHLLLSSAARLAPGGLGVFVVTPRFLFSGAGAALAKLPALGLRVTALIDVPHGAFRPYTMIPTLVVLVERGEPMPEVFVGRVSDDEKQIQALLGNLRKRKAGPRPELGALVPLAGYRGLNALLYEREIEQQGRRTGGTPTSLGAIAKITQLRTAAVVPTDQPNSFFFPLIARSRICERAEDLPKGIRDYVHVTVDPDLAVASVVIGMLESPLGQQLRHGLAWGGALRRIPANEVENLRLWLPSPEVQRRVADLSRKVQALQDELGELNEQLCSRPGHLDDVEARVSRLNHTDSFQEWVDTLPFPLASVLWTYHTLKDPLKRYYQLDFFFEALVQYLAIVLMSGVHQDANCFAAEWKSIQADLESQRMSIQRASFGTWMAVFRKLAKTVRAGLGQGADSEALWRRLFAIDDKLLLAALVSKDMASLLQKANKYRNDWRGHGGVVGDEEARRRDALLSELLGAFRHLVGLRWATAPLVTAISGKFIKGNHRYQVRKVVGVRAPFEVGEFDVRSPLEDGRLHVLSPQTGETCLLLPFVRLGPSPTGELNACYFFNRLEGAESRWISFHFEQQPEATIRALEVLDAELLETVMGSHDSKKEAG